MASGAEETIGSRVGLRWAWVVAASILAVGAIALVWFVAVSYGMGICPAIDPAPTNCAGAFRAGSGLVATIAILVVYGLTLWAAMSQGRTARSLMIVGVILLGIAPFVAYMAVAWSPGFTL